MFRPLVTPVVARTKEREFGFIQRFHAAYLRFRPLLKTALTAIIGQLPLLYGSGSGDIQRPLAVGGNGRPGGFQSADSGGLAIAVHSGESAHAP